MTTLAQYFLDGKGCRPSPHDGQLLNALTLEYTTAKDFAKMADRVVFDDQLLEIYHDMLDNDQIEPEMIFRNVKLPSDKIWVEWNVLTTDVSSDGGMQVGALFEMTHRPELPVDMLVMCRSVRTGGMGIVAKYKINPPPYLDQLNGTGFKMTWSDTDGRFTSVSNGEAVNVVGISDPHDPRWGQLMNTFLKGAFFGLFLLQQPRVTDVTEVKHADKLQAKRKKKGKPPLVEYRRVRLKVGVVAGKTGVLRRPGSAAPGDGAGGGRKKYHHVLGHFRCYHRDTPNEAVIWIAPHYRGDPTLGVVLREKHLVPAAQKA